MSTPGFPPSFAFGTATSATQVEGGCTTIDWLDFARQPGRVANGDTPLVACDHWARFREDVELQAALGMTMHRLSLEWGRVSPAEGRVDAAVLDRYREELKALKAAGIDPMVTLHHFTLPVWLARRGGVLAPDFPARFEEFARTAAGALGDLVSLWVTLNEPNVFASQGFVDGVWPPGKKAPWLIPSVVRALGRAHRQAYAALHTVAPSARVGIAHHLRVATPASDGAADRAAAGFLDRAFNQLFLDLPQDWLGVNYYTRDVVRFVPGRPGALFLDRRVAEGAPVNDLGWELYPQGLGEVLRRLAPRGKPLYITENGIADAKDTQRAAFLDSHLREVQRAIADGVDVRGYLHWSLLDNFEWAEGYGPRFGLYAVDYATQGRTLRASGRHYADLVRQRRVE